MIAANECQQRRPNSYLAESEEEVQNILNPRLGDIAIIATEDVTATYRLRDPSEVPEGSYSVPSNKCEYVWVLSAPNTSNIGGNVTAAQINALLAAGRPVVLPEGEFEMDDSLDLGTAFSIEGQGRDRTILDFTSGPSVTALFATGSMTALPALSGTIVVGQMTVTFASAHGLAERDIFVLENTTDGSFNDARPIYHDGEWFQVAQVLSATQVLVTQPAYSNYTAGANISIWKVDPARGRIKGVGFKFKTGLGANISGIQVSLGADLVFEDIDAQGSQYTQIWADRCFGVRAENCNFFDVNTTIGNNYGIALANCQHVRLIGLSGRTLRHVISFGGGNADGAVPCSDIQIIGGDFGAAGDTGGAQWAVDFHGNCRHYQVIGVDSKSGLILGGDNGKVIGGFFGNMNDSGYCIAFSEVCGMNFDIDGPTCYAVRTFQNAMVSCFGTTAVKNPSVLNLRNITLDTRSFTGPRAIDFGVSGIPATSEITVNVDGGSLSTNRTAAEDFYAIRYICSSVVGSAIKTLRISGFKSNKAGFSIQGDVSDGSICNNEINGALRYGIHVALKATNPTYSTNQKWVIDGNKTPSAMRDGIYFQGSTVYSDPTITNNFSINCGQEALATYTSIRVDGGRNVEVAANDVGDTQSSPTQSAVYVLSNITNLLDTRNRDLGLLVNPSLAIVRSAVTNTREDPPVDGPQWDYSADGFAWGAGAVALDTLPYAFRRDRNAVVQWNFSNKIAAGNTSAGMAIEIVGGATGNSASGGLRAWPQDYVTAYRAGKIGPEANSDADGLYFAAISAGQIANFYIGGTNLMFQIDGNTTAAESGILIRMDGTMKRVTEDAVDTAGAGFRALRVPN